MNARKLVTGFVVAAAAVPIGYKLWVMWQKQTVGPAPTSPADNPVTEVVAKTLKQHQGEDNAFVHAFEDALEHDTQHEEQFAQETGLKVPTS